MGWNPLKIMLKRKAFTCPQTFSCGKLVTCLCTGKTAISLQACPLLSQYVKQRQTISPKRATKADSDEQHVPRLAAEPSIPRIFTFHHKAKKLKRMKGLINKKINLFSVSLGSNYRTTFLSSHYWWQCGFWCGKTCRKPDFIYSLYRIF